MLDLRLAHLTAVSSSASLRLSSMATVLLRMGGYIHWLLSAYRIVRPHFLTLDHSQSLRANGLVLRQIGTRRRRSRLGSSGIWKTLDPLPNLAHSNPMGTYPKLGNGSCGVRCVRRMGTVVRLFCSPCSSLHNSGDHHDSSGQSAPMYQPFPLSVPTLT